ncbi:MAG: hypothetical protein HYU76_02430 [Betaproteobacteria bacterium]|nr:hypothetical protein [Betaproteobacteria bacterium]
MSKTEVKQPDQANAATPKRFTQKTFPEQVKYVAKVIVCLLTFGFVYPHIFSE